MKQYSVLMTVYKKVKPQYLVQSIESMLQQTVPTNDFIIVEDGSLNDELDEVLESYTQRYPQIKLIKKKENKGQAAAANAGLQLCKNDFVARMDADDISLPLRCEKELAVFEENPDIGIVGTGITAFVDSVENIAGNKYMPQSSEEIYQYGKKRNPFNHPTIMFKKQIVMEEGGYNNALRRCEDFDLVTRLISKGIKGRNIKECLLLYRSDQDQFKRRTTWTAAKSEINVVYNNWKRGYASIGDYISVCVIQMSARIIPKKLGQFIYHHILLK